MNGPDITLTSSIDNGWDSHDIKRNLESSADAQYLGVKRYHLGGGFEIVYVKRML